MESISGLLDIAAGYSYSVASIIGRRFLALRFVAWMVAFFGGYFWEPCPLCGRRFGGHEKQGILMTSPHHGVSVCIRCAQEAERRNQKFYDELDRMIVQAF